jgi:hypothetical protein
MGQHGSRLQAPDALEAVEHSETVPRFGVRLVGGVLRDMDVQPATARAGEVHASLERIVRQRERRVRTDQTAHQSRVRRRDAIQEPAILRQAGEGVPRAVAVRCLVGEDGPHPELLERIRDDVERSVDRGGRGMVVYQRGRPGQQRLHRGDPGGGADRRFVQRPVQPPPHAPEDLHEVARRFQVVRHPPGQRRVGMRVGTDVARDHEATPGVDDAVAVAGAHEGGGAHGRDPIAIDDDRSLDDLGGVQADDHRGAGQDGPHGARLAIAVGRMGASAPLTASTPAVASDAAGIRCARRGTAARAAEESRIGSRVRRMPSNR